MGKSPEGRLDSDDRLKAASPITSRHNPIVARFRRALRQGPSLEEPLVLEGPRLLDDAIAAGVSISLVAVSTSVASLPRVSGVIRRVSPTTDIVVVADRIMLALSPVTSPSGVVALATAVTSGVDDMVRRHPSLIVGLLGVQDPGNTGAVIRAVEAGGASGVVTVDGANPFGWKAVRGSMGSVFRLPVVRAPSPIWIREHACLSGLRVVAAVPRGGVPLAETDLRHPSLIWLGAEGPGLTRDLVDTADDLVSIPMQDPVESLNIAVAAALVVYEAARQRRDDTAITDADRWLGKISG
ncbi:MAG: RNA methyltransferase [Acidobacteriota bacterium]|nr:RNA methyltransferase [Acidobacteriota bacterium]